MSMDPDQVDVLAIWEAMRGQIMDLNEEVKDLKREVTRSHSIIDEKQDEIGNLRADLHTSSLAIQSLKAGMTHLQKESRDFRVATLEDFDLEIKGHKEQLARKQEEIGKLIADLQTMAEEADEIERLKSDNEFLDRQLTHCWKYAGAQRTVIEYQYSIMDSSIQYKKLTEDV